MAGWVWPVNDRHSNNPYGTENDRYEAGYHTGVDWSAQGAGSTVRAASAGRVILAKPASAGSPYGNYVIIDHGGGIFTLYAHLRGFNVNVGDRVGTGERIGAVGSSGTSSGAHLHFEVRKGDGFDYYANIDPVAWLKNQEVKAAPKGYGVNERGSASRAGDGGGKESNLKPGDFGFDPQFLKAHPEIERLVDKAIDREWSETRFQSALKETRWWQNHTAAQRDWQLLQVEDPAEADKVLKDYETQIKTLMRTLGVEMKDKEIRDLAERAAKNAMDSTELQMIVGRHFSMPKADKDGDRKALTGQAGQAVYDLESMADDFAIPISRQQKAKWTTRILQGTATVDDFAERMREQAKALYPHLADTIDRAGSVRAWADSYLQQAANLLGVSPETMRLDKGPYAQLLAPTKDGAPLNMEQWQRIVMNDERFGFDKTNSAQDQAAQLAAQLGSALGAI